MTKYTRQGFKEWTIINKFKYADRSSSNVLFDPSTIIHTWNYFDKVEGDLVIISHRLSSTDKGQELVKRTLALAEILKDYKAAVDAEEQKKKNEP